MRRYVKRTLCTLVLLAILSTLALAFPLSTTASSTPQSSIIAIGNNFMVVQTTTGEVWGWGDNSNGVLGSSQAGTTQNITVPTKINLPGIQSLAISAGYDHVLMLASDGNVYAWGNNSNGQLGTTATDTPVTAPTLVAELCNKEIIAVAAGNRFSLALSEDGSIYSFGLNTKLQLGYTFTKNESDFSATPTKIESLNGISIVGIYAGQDSAVAIDTDGKAYLWGSTKNCILGIDEGASAFQIPTLLPDTKTTTPITSVAISQNHSAFLLNNGTVGFMGLNTYGQYGNATTDSNPSIRFKTTDTSTLGVTAIAANDQQTVLLGTNGTVYAAGACVPGNTDSASSTFAPLFGESAQAHLANSIAAGYRNGAMVAKDGSVWTWGDNSCGQLGNGKSGDAQATPTKVLGSDDFAYITGNTPYIKDVPLQFTTSVPSPQYAVVIPSSIDVGELRQTLEISPSRYSWTQFEIKTQNVENLFGEKAIRVWVTPNEGDGFCLQDTDGNTLPFELFPYYNAQDPIGDDGILKDFTESDQVDEVWIRIDKSQISQTGAYSGVLTFYYSLVDVIENDNEN